MAAIRETVFTDTELLALVAHGHSCADAALSRNKQEHYESYEKLATALAQVLGERNALRKGASDAAGSEQEATPDAESQPSGARGRRRLRGE